MPQPPTQADQEPLHACAHFLVSAYANASHFAVPAEEK